MPKLLIFPDPVDAHCELKPLSGGTKLVAVPDTHQPTGRPGQSFAIPPNAPQGNGWEMSIIPFNHPTKLPVVQRGILWFEDANLPLSQYIGKEAAFDTDDFICQDIPNIPPPDNGGTQDPTRDPMSIINAVKAAGNYDLTTHDGCGQFTEACCKALHEQHSASWGHVRKTGAQENYNGHGIDAIQILEGVDNASSGTYDIIRGSQAPGAQVQFIRVDNAHQNLWYYPA